MDIISFIDLFEKKSEVIKNRMNSEITYRCIQENIWQKIKTKAISGHVANEFNLEDITE